MRTASAYASSAVRAAADAFGWRTATSATSAISPKRAVVTVLKAAIATTVLKVAIARTVLETAIVWTALNTTVVVPACYTG